MDELHSISEFLAMAQISRDLLYTLWSGGAGPKVTRIGRRVFICAVDAKSWLEGIAGRQWTEERDRRVPAIVPRSQV
jgi:hypothetical protein